MPWLHDPETRRGKPVIDYDDDYRAASLSDSASNRHWQSGPGFGVPDSPAPRRPGLALAGWPGAGPTACFGVPSEAAHSQAEPGMLP